MSLPEFQPQPQSKLRYVYIDLLRGWAVLVMIETHVVNAFMQTALRLEPWFKTLNFINGIVAPAFLFIAGYSFSIVGQRKWNDYLSLNGVFWKQVGRILQIWAIGYALHLPFFSFNKIAYLIGWEEWRPFWTVDVLHSIAVSLFLMLLLVLIARIQRFFFLLISVVGSVAVFATPFVWSLNVDETLPLPFAGYVNALHGSLFPIFPWMSFVMFGGALGQLYVFLKEKIADEKFFKNVFIAGIACIAISIVTNWIPVKIYPAHDYWLASPGFVFVRLGIVLMLLATLWLWERTAHSGKSIVSLLGSESLVTYSGHLLIIYGLFFGDRSLAMIIGNSRSALQVVGITILLIAAMSASAYVWNSLKKKSMLYARVLQYSILVVVLYVFFTKPY